MAIKCSLLGHRFGESTVERDREEQGSEVIITIRETEVCERCGEERVVSENKEVTSLEMPGDVEPSEPDGETGEEASPEPDDAVESADDQHEPVGAEEGPETDDASADEGAASAPIAEAEDEPATDPVEESEPPVTDDAEILDEDDGPERSPGEWPQEAEPESDHDEEDFDQYGYMDDGADESTVDESATDAEFIDDGSESGGDAELVDDGPDGGDDAEFIDGEQDEAAPEASTGVETNAWPSEDEEVVQEEPSGPGAVTVPDGEYACENCGFSTPVEESSLRAGDFCPECHKETLVQVREQQ